MKKNKFQIEKKSVLIKNDKILVIFQYLQAQLKQFRYYKLLLRIVQAN